MPSEMIGETVGRRPTVSRGGAFAHGCHPFPESLVQRAAVTGPTLVVHTAAGGAKYVAGLMDSCPALGLLGTLAGNDVVVAVCRSPEEARRIAHLLPVEPEMPDISDTSKPPGTPEAPKTPKAPEG